MKNIVFVFSLLFATSFFAGIAKAAKAVIAIYPFTSSTSSYYDYALSVGNAVEAGFVRSGRFTVVERSRFGIIEAEDKFKEANTTDAIKKASRLGASTLVTGHLIGGSSGYTNIFGLPTKSAEISLSVKIIDVVTGEIKISETIVGKGNGTSEADALKKSYDDIDRQTRALVASFMPQRFDYAGDVETDKKGLIKRFKIWGGSAQDVKAGDVIEICKVSSIRSPRGNMVEEKTVLGTARVQEVNSAETSTCEMQRSSNASLLNNEIKANPKSIVFEHKGNTKRKFF